MMSVLNQERLIGVFRNRRNIYRTISENNAKFENQSQNFVRFSAQPIQFFKAHGRLIVKSISGPESSSKMSEAEDSISDTYSSTMSEAMGAVLTYKHELGMNYDFIRSDLIVGSCLQRPEDVDRLRNIGVRTIFCLQQDPDLEYFGVDINAIRRYAQKYLDIEHIRAEIRDFDGYDLRMRLPKVVSQLYKAINRNGGITYIHCTAGMGRAPAVALAYMFWVQGYKLHNAYTLLLSKRSCCPKLDAIKYATADILMGLKKKPVTFKWQDSSCATVEISGLDVGWGQIVPLKFDKEEGSWTLERELPEGRYEYKYIVDGKWVCNEDEPMTTPNKDGHVNNFVVISDADLGTEYANQRKRLTGDDPSLNIYERLQLRKFLDEASE